MKSTKRARQLEQKRQQRKVRFSKTGKGNSLFARKQAYLFKASKTAGRRVFGFEFAKPKPWK